jgi:hypothetical protein
MMVYIHGGNMVNVIDMVNPHLLARMDFLSIGIVGRIMLKYETHIDHDWVIYYRYGEPHRIGSSAIIWRYGSAHQWKYGQYDYWRWK